MNSTEILGLCPYCLAPMTGYLPPDGLAVTPKEGDLNLCPVCNQVSQFSRTLKLTRVSNRELVEWCKKDPSILAELYIYGFRGNDYSHDN